MAVSDSKRYFLLIPPAGVKKQLAARRTKVIIDSAKVATGIIIKTICPNSSKIDNIGNTKIGVKQGKVIVSPKPPNRRKVNKRVTP